MLGGFYPFRQSLNQLNMLNNQAIRLSRGETFVIKNEGRTFTPQTNTSDLKIADFPQHLESPCPSEMRGEIVELINFLY